METALSWVFFIACPIKTSFKFSIHILCVFCQNIFLAKYIIQHVFIILFLLFYFSIFVAFILEAFMLEYSFTHGKIETVISKKIEEKGIGVGM